MELAELGWSNYFRAIVTADDVRNHKPAPDVYLEAAKRLGVDPTDCIAFEDGIKGIQSAHTAGMQVVFVQDQRFEVPIPTEASWIIQSLGELLHGSQQDS